uniref:Uncharacterized protein n=1 Tax=Arundo donax TaxID=35708 RepID=A0A0A8XSV8_ARUDO
MRINAAAPYFSIQMVRMQEIKNHSLWDPTSVPGRGDLGFRAVKKTTGMSYLFTAKARIPRTDVVTLQAMSPGSLARPLPREALSH